MKFVQPQYPVDSGSIQDLVAKKPDVCRSLFKIFINIITDYELNCVNLMGIYY